MTKAENIRLGISELRWNIENFSQQVTISAGVCAFPAQCSTRVQLIQKVDSALYQAKKNGRNCVSSTD